MEGEYAFDLDRILFGKLPWLYLVEILLRTAIIYVYALSVVRLLGKRGMGQLAPFDFVIIIALGSAVGDPMFYPDVPLLHALVAITAIVLFTRGLVHVTQKSRKLKDFISTTPTALVCDGVMQLDSMEEEGISREELFEGLRNQSFEQLGQIDRAYLEPSGKISVFRKPHEDTRSGLPLLPETDERKSDIHEADETVLIAGSYACWDCGFTQEKAPGARFGGCPACGRRQWIRAVSRIREALTRKADAA
jgi:uncharacterized membrane protein YcaP (DUF421 family)